VHLGGKAAMPAFLAARDLVVVPALTPYSTGLDVLSDACIAALAPYGVVRGDLQVVAASADRVYPFGTLSRMRAALGGPVSRDSPVFPAASRRSSRFRR
jgi:metallophosphoesterase superfamily enzyme